MESESFWEHWVSLRDFYFERLRSPIRHPTFIIYFFIAVLGVGGCGVWVSLWSDVTVIGASLYTYFLALTAASAFDLLLSDGHPKYVRATAITVGIIIALLAGCMMLHPKTCWSIVVGILGSLIAALLWWIANAENPKLSDAPPNPSTGGDTNRPIPGSTEGYTT